MTQPKPLPLVFVADDDDGVRRSLAMLLEGAGYRVRSFPTGEAMMEGVAAGEAPACAVVDVRMGEGMTGLDVQRAVSAGGRPSFPVIIVTGHADVPMAVAAMRLGVANFLEKPYPPDEMLDAIEEAIGVPAAPAATLPALTPREKAVLTALVSGQSNKEIARDMGISHRTVEVHRASMMARLGARSLADAVRIGLAAGLGQGGG